MKRLMLWAGVGLGLALLAAGLTAPAPWIGTFAGVLLVAGCGYALTERPHNSCPARGCPGPELDYTGEGVIGCGSGRPDASCPVAP